MKNTYYLISILLITVGCSSGNRYDEISKETEAIQEERKALVNLEAEANALLKAEQKYSERKKELKTIRNSNENKGYPIAPNEMTDTQSTQQDLRSLLKQELGIIQTNYDAISGKVDKLENEKKNIVKEEFEQ